MKIVLLLSLILSACGGGEELPSSLLSQRPAVPCSESAECMNATAPILTCDETVRHGQAVSTWDAGITWVIGNCDDTAPTTPIN